MKWKEAISGANRAAKRTGVRQVVLSHERWADGRPQEWCWHFVSKGSDQEWVIRGTRGWLPWRSL